MKQYRGLTKDGKWVYGWYVFISEMHIIIPVNATISFCAEYDNGFADIGQRMGEWPCQVIPETVGQSTGLKDKNGKGTNEAYEGDIAICSCKGSPILRFKGVITYNPPEFYLACFWESVDGEESSYAVGTNNRSLIQGFWSIDEIIGDIHTTPELLEKQCPNNN